jgi:DNA-binding XRE family transcriptional regulator/predicted RNase H-like HicB family nuclease
MTMAWPIRFAPDGDGFVAQGLPPLTGVITGGDSMEEARFNAREALTGVLLSRLDSGAPIDRPEAVDAPGVEMIEPEAEAVAPIQLRWAREDAGLTQGQLAERLGITYQAVQKLERAGANPGIKTMAKVCRALGRKLVITIA